AYGGLGGDRDLVGTCLLDALHILAVGERNRLIGVVLRLGTHDVLQGPQHVFGRQVSAIVELDALADSEGPGSTVLGHVPLAGDARCDGDLAVLEARRQQEAMDYPRELVTRGGEGSIEPFGPEAGYANGDRARRRGHRRRNWGRSHRR